MCQTSTHGRVAGATTAQCEQGDVALLDGCPQSAEFVRHQNGKAVREALSRGNHVYVHTSQGAGISDGTNSIAVYKDGDNGALTDFGLVLDGEKMSFKGNDDEARLLANVDDVLSANGSLVTRFPFFQPPAITDHPSRLATEP